MVPSIEKLRIALRLAELAGVQTSVLKAAAAELAGLLDQFAIAPDPRRVATIERGRAIARAIAAGVNRPLICERLGISVQQYHRALRRYRDSRYSSAVERIQRPQRKRRN